MSGPTFRQIQGRANGDHVNPMALPPPIKIGGPWSNSPPRYPCNWPGCHFSSVDYNALVRHVQTVHDNSRDNYLLARRGVQRLTANPSRPGAIPRTESTPGILRTPGPKLARTVS